MSKRHINIPIFIPHLGCPNDCVFCNQRKISGKDEFVFLNAKDELDRAFSTVDTEKCEVEIAFFGGSFTGIDRGLMTDLLELAEGYIKSGKAHSLRLSTRPDYIDDEVLDVLSNYSVKTIELGIQSVNDKVLFACKRGHTFKDTKKAVELVVNRGFALVGQMMIGLPDATPEDEIMTAKFICDSGASMARIYPTVVFYDTELEHMAESGIYRPLSDEEAIERSAKVYEIFASHGVSVIRVGLHSSENLSNSDEVYAGANHPALGERVMSRIYFDRIVCEIESKNIDPKGKDVIIYAPVGETSKVIGQNGENRKKLFAEFGIKSVKVVEKSNIIVYNIILEIL
ncbi:MAG: radical SAM protein [Clostridia bacterium]|nr:radical SAM protein [Clostridia bacterium]